MNQEITILYAENELAHFVLAKRLFSKLNVSCSIEHFKNGKELLDYLHLSLLEGTRQLDKTVLMIDLNMPIMDGIEVLEQIRRDPRLRDLPVVVFTTNSNRVDLKKCYDLGCVGLFEKIFNLGSMTKLYDLI